MIADPQARENRLCELNVTEQVRNVARTTIVQDAWRNGHDVQLHGWIYGLKGRDHFRPQREDLR